VGTGNYGNRWAVYTPLGGGVQFRLDEENYIFLQANYRVSMQSANLDNNLFFSLAFTESINSPKKAVVQAPPPVPVVVPIDSDHDGVPDSLDACPNAAGPAELKGCPDSDGDGIPDKDDKCPDKKGLPRYNGCPIPDSDGDGINDEEDKCPLVAGVKRYNGCPIPDRDNDGVNDEEDKCPDLAGDPANHGCPVVKAEVKKRADYAAQHVFFQSASFVLLKRSFKSLDEIVLLMNNDPALKLYVDGYTDNSGKPEKNLLLSENRAASVKKYLTGKGIAAERIQTAGHGPANPIADNKTPSGRAKNRRVEMRLDYL
jgi:outer membrane protein OmpA-like peptidoglycan-associated protein